MKIRVGTYYNKQANNTYVEIGELTIYFSYKTPIAFYHYTTGIVVRENDWGPTTGKHLNSIEPEKANRLHGDTFEKQLNTILTVLNIKV